MAALARGAGALAVAIPALGDGLDYDELIERLDGLLLPGSPSNVMPHHYDGPPSEHGTLHDEFRDATTLPLIPRAVAAGVPVLGICRGFQEMNVAYGGTLWQKLDEEPGYPGHREDVEAPLEVQYGPAHEVELVEGGLLRQLAGTDRLMVNSLHMQGVRTLGRGLAVEARAADGLIEAFRVQDAPTFAVAVQWHPEWRYWEHPFSSRLFAAFGEAALARARAR